MKKTISFNSWGTLASILILSIMLGSCGNKVDENTIVHYTHRIDWVEGPEYTDKNGNTVRDSEKAVLVKLAQKYEAETGNKVIVKAYKGFDVIEKLLKVKDTGIDVLSTKEPDFPPAKWKLYLAPVMSYDDAKEKYKYPDLFLHDDTNVYGVVGQYGYDTVLVYNQEVINSVGYTEIPPTLKEFEAMLQKIRAAGKNPMALYRRENWPLLYYGTSIADFVDGTNDQFAKMLKYDDPFSKNRPMGFTLQLIYDWTSKGFFEEEPFLDFGGVTQSIGDGSTAMMITGTWIINQIPVPDGKKGIIKMTAVPDLNGKGRFVKLGRELEVGISKYSTKKELAKQWINYMVSDAEFAKATGYKLNLKNAPEVVFEDNKIIDRLLEEGKVQAILSASAATENYKNAHDVLKDINLSADWKYATFAYDSALKGKEAFAEYINRSNQAWKKAKGARDVNFK